MDIRELRLFLHLAESCHFGKTAAAMYISPSTLSRQIQRLEESLGHPLFLRDNRTVQLTAAGEQLKKFAQETVLQYQQLQHALNHQSPSLTGELRLFCSVTAAYSHLPQILDQFRAEHPQVEIKLTTGDAADAVEKVQSQDADLGIAGKPEKLPDNVRFHQIGEIPSDNRRYSRCPTGKIFRLSFRSMARHVNGLIYGLKHTGFRIRRFMPRCPAMKRLYRWWH